MAFNSACEPTITSSIAKAPTNGSVKITKATRIIPKKVKIGTSELCAGREIPSRNVTYTPKSGFKGADRFSVGLGWHGGGKVIPVEVTVN